MSDWPPKWHKVKPGTEFKSRNGDTWQFRQYVRDDEIPQKVQMQSGGRVMWFHECGAFVDPNMHSPWDIVSSTDL